MSQVTYRPNAAGSNTAIASQYPNSTDHFDKVDEESADDASTYVYTTSATYQVDTYNFANPAETGTINSVTLHFRGNCGSGDVAKAKAAIYVGSTLYYGDEETLANAWTSFSKQWAFNPATESTPWSWSDLNSLQIGVALKLTSGTFASCTQVYIVVDIASVGGGSYAVVIGL